MAWRSTLSGVGGLTLTIRFVCSHATCFLREGEPVVKSGAATRGSATGRETCTRDRTRVARRERITSGAVRSIEAHRAFARPVSVAGGGWRGDGSGVGDRSRPIERSRVRCRSLAGWRDDGDAACHLWCGRPSYGIRGGTSDMTSERPVRTAPAAGVRVGGEFKRVFVCWIDACDAPDGRWRCDAWSSTSFASMSRVPSPSRGSRHDRYDDNDYSATNRAAYEQSGIKRTYRTAGHPHRHAIAGST